MVAYNPTRTSMARIAAASSPNVSLPNGVASTTLYPEIELFQPRNPSSWEPVNTKYRNPARFANAANEVALNLVGLNVFASDVQVEEEREGGLGLAFVV